MTRLNQAIIVGVGLVLVLVLVVSDLDLGTRAAARTGKGNVARGQLHAGHFARLHPAGHPAHSAQPADPVSSSSSPTAVVTLAGSATQRVPTSFLGISTEYWTLPLFETHATLLERALALVRSPGTGPLILRVGGDSADHTFWNPHPRKAPPWVVQLTPRFLHGLRALVNEVGMRLILDLNLVTDSPLTAARWAEAADANLPRGSIIGFEVGNEPDLYARRYWSWTILHPAAGMSVVPKDLTADSYTRDFEAYSDLLAQAAAGPPLVGPAVAHPGTNRDWISTLIGSKPSHLGMISGHEYPYSACAHPGARSYPTIGRVLSEAGSAGVAQRIAPAVRLAHEAGLPFRLTELNSVTCGGKKGVSDTFATALWAPDALFELLRAGVDGVNIHVRARAINAAFSLDRHGMTARPLFYGMMLFNRTLGPGARLAAVRVAMPQRLGEAMNLKVWAVRINGGGLRLLILDKGNHAANVQLRVPATGAATVQRLLAPSVTSRTGVTLAGQRVGLDARWHGAQVTQRVFPGRRGYVVSVPRMSAALVALRLSQRPAG
jgi:hypothetical protein